MFTLPFLQAVSDWQRDGDPNQNRKRGQVLKKHCASLPERYRTCDLCCFRQIALPKAGVWDLIGEDSLSEKISSWTVDIEVAKDFKGGVPPKGQGLQGVVLCVYPPANSVIVSLRELYKDCSFVAAMDRERQNIKHYDNGAGRHGHKQNEVVLEISGVKKDDIYSMGGHSSQFDMLVEEAAALIYGCSPTPEQVKALFIKVEHLRCEAGPKWLSKEATQRIITEMKPDIERLGDINRRQKGIEAK